MKTTGVIRPDRKGIIPFTASSLLFAVLDVFAWDRSDPRFNILIVLILSAMLALLVYRLLYINKRITLGESTVELCGFLPGEAAPEG